MEKNNTTLQRAIQKLPSYEAPSFIWEEVDAQLTAEEQLTAAIEQLPSYEAPSVVWESIEEELEQGTRIISFNRTRWMAIAAAIAVLLVATFWLIPTENSNTIVSTSITTETINQELLEDDWTEDEDLVQMVVERFSKSRVAKTYQFYEELLIEFNELSTAMQEVKEMIALNGKAVDIVIQIRDIERDRDEIVKQMANLI